MTDLEKAVNNVPKVFEAGRESFYDEFWDEYQKMGASTSYNDAFKNDRWNDKTFNPKYDIILPQWGGANIFSNSCITDLDGILKRNNVKFDISKCQNPKQMFTYSSITVIPELEFGPQFTSGIGGNFEGASNLKTIKKIKWYEKAKLVGFHLCSSLEDITLEGINSATLDMHYCPLSKKSIENVMSIIIR